MNPSLTRPWLSRTQLLDLLVEDLDRARPSFSKHGPAGVDAVAKALQPAARAPGLLRPDQRVGKPVGTPASTCSTSTPDRIILVGRAGLAARPGDADPRPPLVVRGGHPHRGRSTRSVTTQTSEGHLVESGRAVAFGGERRRTAAAR